MSRANVALEDIAKHLDISVSTVSRALRNASGIHPSTRGRIISEAKKMGYIPQKRRPAKEGVDAKKRQILVLSAGPSTPGGYLQGLSQEAMETGAVLQIHHSPPEAAIDLLEDASMPVSLREESCDGVILVYHWPEAVIRELSRRCPLVSIMHGYPGCEVDVVGVDTYRGMHGLIQHLAGLGHRRIGFYGLMPGITWSRSRFGAFAEAVVAEGLELDLGQVVSLDFTPNSEEPLLPRNRASIDQVEDRVRAGVRAWVAADDFLGYRMAEALVRDGLEIPRDVSVAGFHRHAYVHSSAVPMLTSTDVDSAEIGRMAFRQLMRRVEGEAGCPLNLQIPAIFAPGESCGP
jgi:LacI family transcriptional regulator